MKRLHRIIAVFLLLLLFSGIFSVLSFAAAESLPDSAATTAEQEKEPYDAAKYIVFALAAGIIVSLIVTLTMKQKLKSVKEQKNADYYVKSGSMVLTKCLDLYLYSTVTRTAKPKNNNNKRN